MTDDELLVRTADALVEVARRVLLLAKEVAHEEISPDEVSARAFAEAKCLEEISAELRA